MKKKDGILVSVIVCIYNAEQFLRQCIDSILDQSYRNLEIILVDDGSDDSSPNICDRYAKIDIRVRVIHKKNDGLVEARKTGVSEAKGDYIGFVDADDWIERDMYENLLKALLDNDAQLVCSGRFEEFSDRSVRCPNRKAPGVYREGDKEKLADRMLCTGIGVEFGVYPTLWDKLFEKDLIVRNQLKVPSEVEYGEDVACAYTCILEADAVVLDEGIYYHYRQHDASMVRNPKDDFIERFMIQQKYLRKRFEELPCSDTMLKQLDWYAYFVMMDGLRNGLGFKYRPPVLNKPLFPYESVDRGSRIALYGTGTIGTAFYLQLKHNRYCDVIVAVDSKKEGVWKDAIPLVKPEKLKQYKFDYLVIAVASEHMANEISDGLTKNGITCPIIWRPCYYE